MPLTINRQTLEIEELAGAQTAQALLRAEALVPGAGREAIEALLADASLVIRNVDVQTDRVVIDGTAWCQAVYRQGEESTLRALTAQAPLNHVFELPELQPGLPSRVHGSVEHVEARYENGHMVFYVSVSLALQVLRLKPVEVITGLDGVDALETDYREIASVKLAAENSVVLPVTEEVSLPAALDARMALMDWANAQIESAAADLGGVRVKGKVNLETLISSGVAGRPVALIKYPLSFERLIELPDWLTEDVQAGAAVEKVETRVDQSAGGEDAVLRIELQVRLSLEAFRTDTANALADAYTTAGPCLELTMAEVSFARRVERLRCVEPFRGTLQLPEGAPAIGTVLAVRALPNLGTWSGENGRTTLEGVLEVALLYMPTGTDRLASAQAELPFAVHCPGELTEESWVHVEAVAADASALMSDRAELRCELAVSGETRVWETARLVEGVEEGESAIRRPGYVICWPGEAESAWNIGKRYMLPVSEVVRLNGGSSALRPGRALVLKI